MPAPPTDYMAITSSLHNFDAFRLINEKNLCRYLFYGQLEHFPEVVATLPVFFDDPLF